jgi:peroxiredoxin
MTPTRLALGLTALFLVAAAAPAPTIGKPAPAFSGVDETGAKHTLADYKGKAVVLEWTNPDCPFVARHYQADTMEKLAAALGAKEVVWLAVNSTYSNTPADTKEWKAEQGFSYMTLQDADGTIGHAYAARTTPHMYVIDADGVLRYQGAIDDDPSGSAAKPVNYVDSAVKAVIAGASPDPSDTKSYGCSVKYKQ